jgi:hypothetical protein
MRLDEHGAGVLTALNPFVTGREETNSWPGTELISERTATIIRFELTNQTVEVLARASGLFAWVQPSLPEDLSILRDDGSAWLTTIAHERDAYLQIDTSELESLKSAIPGLRLEPHPGD